MLEIWIVTLLAALIVAAMAGILWLFIVKCDVVEGWHLGFLEYFQNTPQADPRMNSYVQYRRAIRSGRPLGEDEISALPAYMRNDRLRKALYMGLGIFYAACIGIFGGFALFIVARGLFS